MPSERDKPSDGEIRDLLREIRDGQRELIEMAKEDRAQWAEQRAEWHSRLADQSQFSPDWELWNEANRDYLEGRKLTRLICVVAVCTGILLIVCLTIASVTGWFD